MELELPKHPPPPPPVSKRHSRPKITLQIPEPIYRGPPSAASKRWTPNKYHGWPPGTPVSHHHPHVNPEWYMHMSHASDFLMNTAKSGLSFGEKTAFWIVSKLKLLSKRWFTHFFLMLCLVLYSVMGAGIFMALEGPYEDKYDKKLDDLRRELTRKIREVALRNQTQLQDEKFDHLTLIVADLEDYENEVKEYMSKLPNNKTDNRTWSFINAMYYAGTIYTTIGEIKGFGKPNAGQERRRLNVSPHGLATTK